MKLLMSKTRQRMVVFSYLALEQLDKVTRRMRPDLHINMSDDDWDNRL